MKQVTQEEWADYCAGFRCYHTSGLKESLDEITTPLVTKLIRHYDARGNIVPGDTIGVVRYFKKRTMYFIYQPVLT